MSNPSRQNVAAINAKTMAFCRRFIAGPSDSFICQDRDGAVVTDEGVIAHIKSDNANS